MCLELSHGFVAQRQSNRLLICRSRYRNSPGPPYGSIAQLVEAYDLGSYQLGFESLWSYHLREQMWEVKWMCGLALPYCLELAP